MANTFASVTNHVPGDLVETIVDLTIVDNYATGGWPITAANLGLSQITLVDVSANPSTGHPLAWDYTNSKLKAFTSGGSELANASAALSGNVIRLQALGRR